MCSFFQFRRESNLIRCYTLLDFLDPNPHPLGRAYEQAEFSCACCVWWFLSVLPAVAQTQAGISGVIHDPSRCSHSRRYSYGDKSATNFGSFCDQQRGRRYNFPVLQPGRYNIKVELAGFPHDHARTMSNCRSSSGASRLHLRLEN